MGDGGGVLLLFLKIMSEVYDKNVNSSKMIALEPGEAPPPILKSRCFILWPGVHLGLHEGGREAASRLHRTASLCFEGQI